MARVEIWYRWRYFCEIRQKHFTTKYHCSERQIRIEHPDAVAVESSARKQLVYESLDEAMKATATGSVVSAIKYQI